MRLAIPSSPSRLCYWSFCNDLPKDPDFLATACHQTFGRSSTFSLFVRNGSTSATSPAAAAAAAAATAGWARLAARAL